MSFGQPTGPPASASQLKQLLALLEAAGFAGFRDARGPMRLTQRQAGGKFTRDEASELIDRLEQADADGQDQPDQGRTPEEVPTPTAPRRATAPKATAAERALLDMPDALLAAELQRRGWIVVEP